MSGPATLLNSRAPAAQLGTKAKPPPPRKDDGKHNYAIRIFNEGMLALVFRDMIRFGNGEWCVKMYKWILPLSRIHSSHSKYATEALYLHACVNFLLSPRMAHKITWNRFCCTVNRRGRNIPSDRRLEHLNRLAKDFLAGMGHQNLTEENVQILGAAIRPLHDLGRAFDKVSSVSIPPTYIDRDVVNEVDEAIMLRLLLDGNVFEFVPGRFHKGFKGICQNPFDDVQHNKLRGYVLRFGKQYEAFQAAAYSRLYPVRP